MVDQDIIWITLESVRQDHTSLANYQRDTTPYLSHLGSTGYTSEYCFSHDIWTRSSSASILSGHAASAHQTWSTDAKLPESITTIPQEFNNSGYKTVCITSNGQLGHETGLDRGFTHFHHIGKNKSSLLKNVGLRAFGQWLLNLRQHSCGFARDEGHCVGYLNNQVAKKHIKETSRTDDQLFLYLHHGDSHHPYIPPISWRNQFVDDLPIPVDEAVNLALDMSHNLHQYIAQDEPFSDEEWEALRVLYDTSIAYVDHLTGKLIEYAQKQLNDPIVVVTGDHGELFGEHGLLAHMLVTNTAVSNVPLVISGLEKLPENSIIQHADVMKVICEKLNINHSVPIGQDIRKQPRQFAVTQRGGARAQKKLKKIVEYNASFPKEEFHINDLTSIQTKQWRYQSSEDRRELFSYPDEITDVSDTHIDLAVEFDELLRNWIDDFGEPVGEVGVAEFDKEMEKQLRDLGYLQ